MGAGRAHGGGPRLVGYYYCGPTATQVSNKQKKISAHAVYFQKLHKQQGPVAVIMVDALRELLQLGVPLHSAFAVLQQQADGDVGQVLQVEKEIALARGALDEERAKVADLGLLIKRNSATISALNEALAGCPTPTPSPPFSFSTPAEIQNSKRLQLRLLSALSNIELYADEVHPKNWLLHTEFYDPVDTLQFPDYQAIIAQPMCLRRIVELLEEGYYGADNAKLRADLLLIGTNCQTFNAEIPYWKTLGSAWNRNVEKNYKRIVQKKGGVE